MENALLTPATPTPTESDASVHKKFESLFAKINKFKWWAKQDAIGVYESLDYDTCYHPGEVADNEKGEKKHIWGYTGVTLVRWCLTVVLGVTLGCAARGLEECIKTIVTKKAAYLQQLLDVGDFDHPALWAAWAFYTFFNLSLCMIAACMVVFIEPAAAGSGIPEVKAYLNGTHIPDFLRFRTIVVKVIGIILAVSAGLTVGPEGLLSDRHATSFMFFLLYALLLFAITKILITN